MIWLRQQEHLQCLVTISGRKSSSLLKLYKWIYVQNWRQQGTSKKQKYLVYPTVKSWKVFNCNWWLCWVEMVHPMNTFKYKLGTIIYWICSTAQSQYQYHQSSLFIWSVFDLVARDLNFCMCTWVVMMILNRSQNSLLKQKTKKSLPAWCSLSSCVERL